VSCRHLYFSAVLRRRCVLKPAVNYSLSSLTKGERLVYLETIDRFFYSFTHVKVLRAKSCQRSISLPHLCIIISLHFSALTIAMEDGSHEPFLEKKAQHWDHHNSNTLCSGTDDRHFHDPLENPPVRWCSIRAVAAHVLVLILYTAVYIGYIMFTEHHGKSSSMLTYCRCCSLFR